MTQRKEVFIPQQEEKLQIPKRERFKPKDLFTKLESGEDINLPKPVTDDNGAQIVSPAQPQNVKITLPLTNQKTINGLGQKVNNSFRWLSEWIKRTLKLAGGKFIYKYGRD